jgi:competence ComEA-like helix-hairpin-helix protein
MAKVNANSATREELVEKAGLRPEIADAILGFRGKHGGKVTDVEALGELPGVGPATLEQLRATLDFGDKGQGQRTGNGGGGGDKAGLEDQRETREAAERTARVAASTARAGAETSRGAAETGVRTASTAARSGLRLAERTADAFGEAQRETARRSAEGTAELGQLFAEFVSEQTRRNLEVAATFGRAFDWGEALKAQSEFVRESLERATEFNRRYLELVGSVMRAPAGAAERQARKAA